jgi:hypothetical protein
MAAEYGRSQFPEAKKVQHLAGVAKCEIIGS